MRSVLVALFIGLSASAQSPTAADFEAQIAKLTEKATKDERLQVAKWLRKNLTSKHAPSAIPTLERLIQKDAEPEVRREAVAALIQLVNCHDVPCPVGLAWALRDPVDEVRWEASVLEGPYKRRLAPGALDALIAAASDERDGVRYNSLLHLAQAAGKDAKARKVIEQAKQAKSFEVRHTAHCAWFIATDDVAEFLAYIIRVREEPATVLKPLPPDSEEEKALQAQRNLFVLGGTSRVIEWAEERPDDLVSALLKLLEHKSANMRRGAADLIGMSARKVELKRSDPFEALRTNPFESLLPYLDPDGKLSKEKPAPPESPLPSKAYARLLEKKGVAKLRYAATMDSDETVRLAARRALQRFAEVPEPLTVRPREVQR
jgi:hypothetical protein